MIKMNRPDLAEAIIGVLGDSRTSHGGGLPEFELFDDLSKVQARASYREVERALSFLSSAELIASTSSYGNRFWLLLPDGVKAYDAGVEWDGAPALRRLLEASDLNIRWTNRGGATEVILLEQHQHSSFSVLVDHDPREPINLRGGYVSEALLTLIEIVEYWRRCGVAEPPVPRTNGLLRRSKG